MQVQLKEICKEKQVCSIKPTLVNINGPSLKLQSSI